MKCKSLMAIMFAISVATTQATEKQSLLSRLFGAVFSSASSVKEKAFCDTPNQIASVTTVGLVSAILGWFGYKKYQKQQQLIPVQKHELRKALANIKWQKKYAQEDVSKSSENEKFLMSRVKRNKKKLYKAAVSEEILAPREKMEMLKDPDVQQQLYLNPRTSQIVAKCDTIKNSIFRNKLKMIERERYLRDLEKQEELLLKKQKNFGFFDSIFFSSPFKQPSKKN